MKKFVYLSAAIVIAFSLVITGCSFDLHNPRADEYDVQIIGDSIFDYSGDIRTVLKSLSGKGYKDRSVSGKKIDGVIDQYNTAIYYRPSLKTVIADGGGNDVLQGSADCESDPLTQGCVNTVNYVADRMEYLLEDMSSDGVDDCVWLGYYYLTGVEEEKNEALAFAYDLYPGILQGTSMSTFLVDPRSGYDSNNWIKSDDIHPTWDGSVYLANQIWDVMVSNNLYR